MRLSSLYALVIGAAVHISLIAPAMAQKAAAGPPACSCENFDALKAELALAITLMDKHAAKAKDLRDKYGDNPKEDQLAEARRDYERFEEEPKPGEKPAPGSARDGLPPPPPGSPKQIAFTPRGQKLFAAHANDNRNNPDNLKGIPDAVKYTPIGRPEPDLSARKAIEDKFRKAKQDLCDYADEEAMKKQTSSGGACGGIGASLATHEAIHQQTCRKMGYYAFSERSPAQLADDEVRAYKAQVDALSAEMRKVLAKKNVKIIAGAPGGDARSLLSVKVRCVLALSVNGQIDDLKLFGQICDAAEPFTIKTSPNANMKLTPTSEKAGTYAYNGNAGPANFRGSGGYTIDIGETTGTLTLDGSGRWYATVPGLGTASKGGPEKLKITKLRDGCA
jgi:hypothetical protein